MALPALLDSLLCLLSKTGYPPHIGTFRTTFQPGYTSKSLWSSFRILNLFSGCVFTKKHVYGTLLKNISRHEYISILRIFQSVKKLKIEWCGLCGGFFYKEYIMDIMEPFDLCMRTFPLILSVIFSIFLTFQHF